MKQVQPGLIGPFFLQSGILSVGPSLFTDTTRIMIRLTLSGDEVRSVERL